MKTLLALLAAMTIAIPRSDAAVAVGSGDVLAICGDSITQQKVYSAMIEQYLLMCQRVEPRQVVEFGWSGEQAAGLLARVDAELYPFQPSVVTTCYGMNDGHYQPLTPATAEAFRAATRGLIASFRRHGVREIVIGGPGCVDAHYFRDFKHDAAFDPALPAMYNQTLAGLSAIAKEVAGAEGVRFADVHAVMMKAMAKARALHGEAHPFINDNDGVHPGFVGHLAMAYAFLVALGCDGDIGTITLDAAGGSATGTPGQRILSAKNGIIEVESTRFPFCFPADAAEALSYLPFNQELNRYLLVVKGLGGAGAKVTWGRTTKTFTAVELATGINLAAEFIESPLCERFGQVGRAIQRQQEQDRELVQTYFHEAAAVPPNAQTAFATAAKQGLEWDRDLYAVSAAMVGAVRHAIRVEALP